MTVTVKEENEEIVVRIDDSHYRSLKTAQARWNFKDLDGLIGYALGIFCVHEGDNIEVVVNDKLKKVYPKAHFLNVTEATELKNKDLKNKLDNLMKDFNGVTILVVSNDEDDEDEYRSKMKDE